MVVGLVVSVKVLVLDEVLEWVAVGERVREPVEVGLGVWVDVPDAVDVAVGLELSTGEHVRGE